jgi:uncharacterized protein
MTRGLAIKGSPGTPPVTSLLVKVASHCNIACTYCYWFRDHSVYALPKRLREDVEKAFLEKLDRHIAAHGLRWFELMFHGGEPLLFGRQRFQALCEALRRIGAARGCELSLAITTNGMLIDPEWAALFAHFGVHVIISLDGPASINDAVRIDFNGQGTHDRVVEGLRHAQLAGLRPTIQAVCNPESDPRSLLRHLVDELNVTVIDLVLPDATHIGGAPAVAGYYTRLFDLWRTSYASRVKIRNFDWIMRGLSQVNVESPPQNYGSTATLTTNGELGAMDLAQAADASLTSSRVNILTHELQAVCDEPLWQEVFAASHTLPADCQICPYRRICGGGPIASRLSHENRFDNPSVYCSDLKAIIGHIQRRCDPATQRVTA